MLHVCLPSAPCYVIVKQENSNKTSVFLSMQVANFDCPIMSWHATNVFDTNHHHLLSLRSFSHPRPVSGGEKKIAKWILYRRRRRLDETRQTFTKVDLCRICCFDFFLFWIIKSIWGKIKWPKFYASSVLCSFIVFYLWRWENKKEKKKQKIFMLVHLPRVFFHR